MLAKPCILVPEKGYMQCDPLDATHVTINIPGPTGLLTLPVILKGTREGSNAWTWNGDIHLPTLRPSVLTRGHDFTCHSWINDGKVQFLSDCSHELINTTVSLNPVTENQ